MKLYNYTKFNESVEDIHAICRKYRIKNYTINSDGSIDVDGDVTLYNKGLSKLPVKFNRVSGYFYCNNNKLTSLEGCPKWVGHYLSCSYNQLTTLKGAPEYVGGHFYFMYNQLTDFIGIPEFYEGRVNFYGNPLFEVIKDIPNDKKTKFIQFLNIYDVIRSGKKIIRDRLEVAYDGIGMELPEYIKIKGYEII